MPSSTFGFSGTEIVNRIISYVGNTKSDFQTYVEQTLPLAEFRFCKMHPWRFLFKPNLSLTVASGTNEYDLSVATIGYYMAAEDVETIFDQTNGIVLKKLTLKDLRRLDPQVNDGSASDQLQYWAPLGDNRIMVYPKTFGVTTLKVDGKVTPVALTTLANYPTIPYRYQESFIQYAIALGLERENDDRAEQKKQEAIQLIQLDVKDDLRSQGDGQDPRMRASSEASFDGVGGADLESLYVNSLFWGW